jgi:uncharacterized protein (TIGR03435 family)
VIDLYAISNHLWQSTVFAVMCGLLNLAMKRNSARVRYGLWLAASLKFLLPFSLLISLGALLPKPSQVLIPSPKTVHFAYQAANVTYPASAFASPIAEEPHSTPLPHFSRILLLLWVAGTAVVIQIWHLRWRQLRTTLRSAKLAQQGPEVEILRTLERDAKRRTIIPVMRSQSMMEPGIFGIFHPVMLWPEKLSFQLTDKEIEAIVAHELAHVRRHDNLMALLHMLVEAIFWFHPMVWWIESRLVEEREHACDEEAILQVGSAYLYAESLLKACRACLESPLPCFPGIAGGNLRKRVLRITGSRLLRKLDLKRVALLCIVGFVSLALPVLIGAAYASPRQSPGLSPDNKQTQSAADAEAPDKFEVVSIRQTAPNEDSGSTQLLPDGFRWKNMPLSLLVKDAYDIQFERQLLGFPSGFDSQHYDIEARMSEEAASKWRALPEKQQWKVLARMERGILADRCQFRAHYENTEQPIYELVIAKGGVKMARSTDEEHSSGQSLDRSHEVVKGTPGRQIVHQIPVYDRVIVDKTGLGDEKYDFDLKWSNGDEQPGDPAEGRPTLFKALEEQLGLKLVPAKGPVKSLVIDHIERPSPN